MSGNPDCMENKGSGSIALGRNKIKILHTSNILIPLKRDEKHVVIVPKLHTGMLVHLG